MFEKVLVTGGSGFVGKRLRLLKPDWVYMSSDDCDLMNMKDIKNYLNKIKPEAIIHLAARVGGIKEASENQSDFFYKNSLININLIHAAYQANIKRVLSCLSTCCFPSVNETYPMVEEDLMVGEPEEINECYSYAKRNLYIQSKWYSREYGLNYNTFTPSNIYGPDNVFDLNKGHLISSMIRKFTEANPGSELTFWGTGKPLRQHIYVDDLAKIIVLLLEKHNTNHPIIVAPNENLSIKEIIDVCNKISGKNMKISFNNYLDGQYRKDGSNKRLLDIVGDFNFTSFEEGLEKTYSWYQKNKES